jgi:tight adherence protein B
LLGVIGPGVATLHDALDELSRSGPPPMRPAMSRYSRLASRLGDRRALEALRNELAEPTADSVLLALGGAVEEGTDTVLRVLGDLGAQITADLQLAEKIRTLQTQSRVANWGCFALPYGILFLLCTANPAYRSYFSQPAGFAIVIAGVAGSSLGFLVCRRLVRPIATGQRVFTGTA